MCRNGTCCDSSDEDSEKKHREKKIQQKLFRLAKREKIVITKDAMTDIHLPFHQLFTTNTKERCMVQTQGSKRPYHITDILRLEAS
jgi:hypothetical protein